MARPQTGRMTGGGGAGPALASTEKRGMSRELMSSGMPSSRLKELEKESLVEELKHGGADSGSGSESSSTCMPGTLIMSARPGRRYVCGVSNPALASTEKRGTSRELMSSGIPSSRLKDLEKEPSFGEVLSAVMSSTLAFSIPRRRNAILGTESRGRCPTLWICCVNSKRFPNSLLIFTFFTCLETCSACICNVHRSRGDGHTVEGADMGAS
jgi:hypothetical protein